MPISLAQSASIAPDVIFRLLDGEAVLLNLKTGTYFGLDQVGTRAWELILEHQSLERVHSALLEEYDVDPDRLAEDLLTLVNEFSAKGLVQVAG
jgi:Coenzyme PQQ synthesis protein D (PqqD)